MSDSQEIRSLRVRLAVLQAKVDEIVCQGDLSSDITELRPDGKEKIVLLSEWARVVFSDLALDGCHVGIGDLGHGDYEEDTGKDDDKSSYTEIHPLYVGKRRLGIDCVGKEDAGGEKWRHEGASALDTLGEVGADFGIFWEGRRRQGRGSQLFQEWTYHRGG